jgi:hypothetical protein
MSAAICENFGGKGERKGGGKFVFTGYLSSLHKKLHHHYS